MYAVINNYTGQILYSGETRGECNQWLVNTYPSFSNSKCNRAVTRILPYPMRIVEISSYGFKQND